MERDQLEVYAQAGLSALLGTFPASPTYDLISGEVNVSERALKPQSRLNAVLHLLFLGLAWGLLGAGVGGGLGYFLDDHTLLAALRGMDMVSIAFAIFAGAVIVGHSQVGRLDVRQTTWVSSSPPPSDYPWPTLLIALFASGTCAGLEVLARALLLS